MAPVRPASCFSTCTGKGRGLFARARTLQEAGTSDGGRDYGFTGEENSVSDRLPFTALLKAPQLASSSQRRTLVPHWN